jgi:esterase/lipase
MVACCNLGLPRLVSKRAMPAGHPSASPGASRGVESGAETGYLAVMATVLLFHHAQGQTPGFLKFADDLRAAGHTVHAPDLYDGRTFRDLKEGVAYAKQVGFPEIIRRGSEAAKDLTADIVYAGFSLGVLPAQALA